MKNKLIISFCFVILFLIGTSNAQARIIMPPYLQGLTTYSVYILVETDNMFDSMVFYGEDEQTTSQVKSESYVITENVPATYVQRIYLSNLKPGKKYFYKVLQDGEDTPVQSFRTAQAPESSFRFAVTGDGRSNPRIHGSICNSMKSYTPEFVIFLGDLAYNSLYKTWKDEFFVPELLKLASSIPFFNAVGNHEGWKQNTKAFTQAPEGSSSKQEYYSFIAGDVHFIVLSTEHQCGKGTAQYKFLESELKHSKSKWKIVSFHVSAYVGGGHGENFMMKKVSEELFEKYKVDMVLTGHTHFYQHNIVKGIHHITIAGGGAPLYTPIAKKYTIKSAKEFHYGIFDVTPNSIKMVIYNLDGKVIDDLTLEK